MMSSGMSGLVLDRLRASCRHCGSKVNTYFSHTLCTLRYLDSTLRESKRKSISLRLTSRGKCSTRAETDRRCGQPRWGTAL